MQRPDAPFPLLSLPELPLLAILECLEHEDKLYLASCCRKLATAVSAASQNPRVTVTRKTGWAGLSKILATGIITCKTLELVDQFSFTTWGNQPAANNALQKLMCPESVPAAPFKGIRKVEIDVFYPLQFLVPPNIVRLLPDMDELSLQHNAQHHTDMLPIPYCSSLRRLSYVGGYAAPQQLPDTYYYTAEDLRKQLPNITSLVLPTTYQLAGPGSWIVSLIQAWGDQLTELQLHADVVITDCQAYLSEAHRKLPAGDSLESIELVSMEGNAHSRLCDRVWLLHVPRIVVIVKQSHSRTLFSLFTQQADNINTHMLSINALFLNRMT